MSVIKFSEAIIAKNPELFNVVQEGYVDKGVTYLINSSYRQAIKLSSWLEEFVTNPSNVVLREADKIPTLKNHDEQAYAVLRHVVRIITYVSDFDNWKLTEYWQTPQETIESKKGDCEDGAILIYVLCRLKGIPKEKCFLMAGDVFDPFKKRDAGHCWFAYKPNNYPLNFVWLDWCYYPTPKEISRRNLNYINKKTIFEYENETEYFKKVEVSNYHSIWFCFNESGSYTSLARAR